MGFAEKYGPWAVVLGASEGLGEAFARAVAGRGINVVVVARRSEPLQGVADDIRGRFGVEARAVALDLGAHGALDDLRVASGDLEVGLAVYNAAASYVGEFEDQTVESMRSIVDVNCWGPLAVCEHFGGAMVRAGRGGIVLMSSGAGLAGSQYNAAYAASKAFDLVLGESLWAEWRSRGVDVLSVIGPAIDTPTFRATMPAAAIAAMPPAMAPADVAEEVLDALGSGPSFVPGEHNREGIGILGTLPRRQQVEAMAAAHAAFARRPDR
ncbi:MAG: SDR family NAD(P)-dependent oxidoreductase [Acidimicrobiia bacterium]|nr:SDR family NAD(P)-dependent oxidoreductase [Acidimicrobiia bacterium]